MKIVVTGAGGWIGSEVAARAQSMAMDVVALDTAPRLEGSWTAYRMANIANDGMFSLARDRVFAGSIAVIHCAGYAHRPVETPDEVARFKAINCDGTGRVIELARRVGVSRFIYLSSIAFYDWTRGFDYDEDGPLETRTAYAASKLGGERLCRESGVDYRVARLGTVFGKGDRANFAKLASGIACGRFLLPGRGDARKSVLPVALAAELLVDLALFENIPHRLLNMALPVAPTVSEICATFTRVCGFPRVKRMPLAILRILSHFGDGVARFRPRFPLTSSNLRKLTTSTTVNTGRMMKVWPNRTWGTFEDWLAQNPDYYRQHAAYLRRGLG